MVSTNWAAAANNNDAGYGYYDEDMPPANENAQPLPSAGPRPININPRWMNQHQQSSPTHVNHVNFPAPAFPFDDGSWMTPHGPRQAHPSVPMNVFVPVPRLQQQAHPVHEQATHVRDQIITPSPPNFDMAYDVGFEQHFATSASAYHHPPLPTIHPPYAHGSSSPSFQERTPESKVLFVHNVPSEVAEDELRDLFSRHGTVTRVSIVRDTGSIAFVHFKLLSEADEARLSLNNYPVSKIFGFIIITYAFFRNMKNYIASF